MTTVYRERHELLTAALATRFAPHLELLPSHTGLHVAAKPGGASVMQIEALARRAAAAGVAIQTLSSLAVGENALAGIVLGYGGIATTDIQEGLHSIGEMLRPIGARRDDHSSLARQAYVVAVNPNRSAEYVHYDHCIIRTRSFHIEERNRTIQ